MSNAIRFLEAIGANPTMTRLSAADYAAVVASLEVDGEQKQALLDRDPAALNDLLGGRRTKMMLALFEPGEDERHHEDAPDDGQTPDDDAPQPDEPN